MKHLFFLPFFLSPYSSPDNQQVSDLNLLKQKQDIELNSVGVQRIGFSSPPWCPPEQPFDASTASAASRLISSPPPSSASDSSYFSVGPLSLQHESHANEQTRSKHTHSI